MARRRNQRLWTCLWLMLTVVGFSAANAGAVTEKQINNTIDQMQKYLFSIQQGDGSWNQGKSHNDREPTGQTAIVTYALLQSGAHAQDPRIQKALNVLNEGAKMAGKEKGTYATAVRNHVWAALPDAYKDRLATDTQWLLQAENGNGGFRYGMNVGNEWDNSATQYGALGVWEAEKRGANIDNSFWRKVWRHYKDTQLDNGGWAYQKGKARGSMTAAGLTVGYIAQQQLYREQNVPPQDLRQPIKDGLQWLDNNFKPGTNPGTGAWWPYYIYGVERVGLASGVRYLNGQDWFRAAAGTIVNRTQNGKLPSHSKRNTSPYHTAFGLLFLARGKVPVWINKLQLNDQPWNRRPNDLYFLSKYMSNYSERRLNWLRAPINTNPRDWLNAPVLYLSTNQQIDLKEAQRKKIKRYIELGGMLVINPEGGNRGVINSATKLGEKLFPDYSMEKIGQDHPLTDLIKDTQRASNVQHISNGARDLMLVLPADWGMRWQADTGRQRETSDPWKAAVNLFALATNRGRIQGRLRDPLVPQSGGGGSTIDLVRAQYDGNWNPEPEAMGQLDQFMKNNTGTSLNVTNKKVSELGSVDAPLVHLAGVQTHTLTDEEKQAIKEYINGGGTILVETVGGRGSFALTVGDGGIENQLAETFPGGSVDLSAASPIITGEGMSNGFDLSRIGYRPYSVVTTGASGTPQMSTIRVNDRPAIIISAEDISVGCLGVPRWNINGYKPDSARKLFANILFYANQN